MAAADVSRGFVALFWVPLFVSLLLFANILLITEVDVCREGTEEAGGGTMFEMLRRR